MTRTLKTVREVLAEQAKHLVPVDGDLAYTIYHGFVWEGILKKTEWNGEEGWGGGWVIVPKDGTRFNHLQGDYKYFERLPVANVSVYGPEEYNLDRKEEGEMRRFGRGKSKNRYVEYDAERGMFYLRAYED